MPASIYMTVMTMIKTNKFFLLISAMVLASCSLSPGMHMKTKSPNSDNERVYIESINKDLEVIDIVNFQGNENESYKIGNGDQISITIWGLPEIFPITNTASDAHLRRVDSNGNIYFPYAGIMKASGRTQDELRSNLTKELSKNFTNPQLDLSIAKFNSQKIYLLGEVLKPSKLFLTDVSISLTDAIGEVSGINNNTASGSEVFIIRSLDGSGEPQIYRADLSSPAGFVSASQFILIDNDVVYVNSKSTTRWNRVISQFFPFSAFLNSVDNLTTRD